MRNKFLRSGGVGLLDGGLGTSFVSVLGIKLVVNEGTIGGTLVGLPGGETAMSALGQEYSI